MYCYKCGNQIAQNDKFCAICGAKTENVVNVEIEKTKKELTDDIIKNELSQQKNGAFVYILSIILLAFFAFASFYLGGFIAVLGLIMFSIFLIDTIHLIKNDKRSKQAKYYVLNRHCVKKTIKEYDGTREYSLWFANRSEDLIVSIEVTKDFYFTTKENELFYVVFLEKEKKPRLCYRKSEWTIKDIGLCQQERICRIFRYCDKCEKNNPGTAKYCQFCGNQLQKIKQNQVKIAELFDGGFCERYLFFGYGENSFFLKEIEYHYNANREEQKKIIKLDSLAGFDELIDIMQKEFSHFISKPKNAKELHCYYLSEATQSDIHEILEMKNDLQTKVEQLFKNNENM